MRPINFGKSKFRAMIRNTSPEQFDHVSGGVAQRNYKPNTVRLEGATYRAANDVKKVLPTLSLAPVVLKKVKTPCDNCGISSKTLVDYETRLCLDIDKCGERAKKWS